VDGEHILSGGYDKRISEWAAKGVHSKIVAITPTRDACLTGDLSTAEELLTQEIHTNANDHTSYAHRSFVMARKHAWDHALDDATKSINIQSSLTGYISKGIALCGKGLVREARIAFDVASMFTKQDSDTNHFLLLIKVIALFNADQHEEAMLLVKELAAACPNADPLGCRVVETYLRVQLGTKALDSARYDEAADHFATAVNSGAFSSKNIHETYEDLTVLFGWDLQSLCLTAHQKRCQVFLSAGKTDEALEAYQYMMDTINETVKASCIDWSNEFKEQCSALAAHGILGAEISGQDQDGCNTEPNFHGIHQHPQISQPRPQQRPGRLKRLRLAMTRTPRSAPPPAPAPTSAPTSAPPTTPPSAAAPITITSRLRSLFPWRSDHAGPPVIDVPFAQSLQCNGATGAPGSDGSLIRDEDYHGPPTPDPNSQQQQQAVAVQVDPGEHGGGKSCVCC
jgi:tetratricopeptide (TPR) repeat protein